MTRVDYMVKTNHSVAYAYSCVNVALENLFDLLSMDMIGVDEAYVSQTKKNIKSNTKSLNDELLNLGDKKDVIKEKKRFLKNVKSTVGVTFNELEKQVLLLLLEHFYTIQNFEMNLKGGFKYGS